MKIPFEMRIKLDDHQNEILNLKEILTYIDTVDDKSLLEFYINAISNEPVLDKDMIKVILDKANERLNSLKGINTLEDLFKVAEEKTDKLSNISIIDTEKEMNDKINGFRKDVTYIKFNDTNEIYEVTNVDKVKAFLSNKEILDTLTENEIRRYLVENSNKIDLKEVDMRRSNELTSDEIKEEIRNINDPYLRDMFMKEQNVILKERVEINEYIKTNMPDVRIEYGLNSNGERIYSVGDKIIKFEGKERNMQILSGKERDENQINHDSFHKYKTGNETDTEMLNEEMRSIYDYDGKEELLDTLIEAIFNNMGISEEQIEFLTNFLDMCVTNQELGNINPGNLQEIFDKYYEYAKNDSSVTNDKIEEIFARYEVLINKTDENEYEKDYSVEHTKVLRFIPKNNNDNITGLDKAAFVSVAVILEATLVGTLIIALISLVK